jgi:diaminopimelate decarboxylase
MQLFDSTHSELHISGRPITAIADRYGTPLFVYDRAALDQKLDLLRTLLPQFDIYYSVKANPNLAILRHFVLQGCGMEVASAGEFMQAAAAGCRPESIVMAGPGKTDKDLELALAANIGRIHVESLREAARIARICRRNGVRARVGIRVNPSSEVQEDSIRLGGEPCPFGIDEERLDSAVEAIASTSCFELESIHVSMGTQLLDCSRIVGQYRKTIAIARALVSKIGRPLQMVDFGGGLGIPYCDCGQELDLQCLANGISRLMDEIRDDSHFKGTRFAIEPGGFLVGEAGLYVSRIIDIKRSRGKKFLILDGGMNHHLAATGSIDPAIKKNHPIAVITKLQTKDREQVDLVGPFCSHLDGVGRNIDLAEGEIGDLVGIFQSGAYARSASSLGFLSHDSPAEVLVDCGQDFLIRSRGTTEDFMRDVSIPPHLMGKETAGTNRA